MPLVPTLRLSALPPAVPRVDLGKEESHRGHIPVTGTREDLPPHRALSRGKTGSTVWGTLQPPPPAFLAHLASPQRSSGQEG